MNYSIKSLDARKIAGFHMVGPWEQTVKQGFEQLAAWVSHHQVPAQEWVAVYYDNPQQVPAENCVVTPLLPWRMITSSRRIAKGSSSLQLPAAITPAPARGSLIMISPRRGCSSLTACCRAESSKSRISPVLKFILTMATRMVTGILRCTWR